SIRDNTLTYIIPHPPTFHTSMPIQTRTLHTLTQHPTNARARAHMSAEKTNSKVLGSLPDLVLRFYFLK
ncbi:MAG: hypothetical protein AAF483_12145, partial [Planctomycetota bacterium]